MSGYGYLSDDGEGIAGVEAELAGRSRLEVVHRRRLDSPTHSHQ